MDLSPHHASTIHALVEAFRVDQSIRALVLGGSLAHGFARPDSDVDVTIVVDAADSIAFRLMFNSLTEQAPHRPDDLMGRLDAILADASVPLVDEHVRGLLAFYGLDHDEVEAVWPTRFMKDTELSWLTGRPPIDDL